MMKHHILLALSLVTCIVLTGCRNRQRVVKESGASAAGAASTTVIAPNTAEAAEAAAYTAKVAHNRLKNDYLTASVKASVSGSGMNLSAGGMLRMKRDDVIRLSLRVIGIEVGLLEFTPQDVLIIDRFHKQYIRASYSEVSFLRAAGLDFYALQSLFWNELFVPGSRDVSKQAARFRVHAVPGGYTLTLNDTPQLTYTFSAPAATPVVRRLTVKGKEAGQRGAFDWTYGGFKPVGGRPFPTTMKMQVSGTGKDIGLDLTLSNLKHDRDWETRTTVSSRYSRRSVDEVLKGLKL